MPPVKPSEKTGHEGEWWRNNHANAEQPDTDPDYERHEDKAAAEENCLQRVTETGRTSRVVAFFLCRAARFEPRAARPPSIRRQGTGSIWYHTVARQ